MQLSLKRSGHSINSLLSTLGRVRETRLTGTLAYLVAHFPETFLPLMNLTPGSLTSVGIEETEAGNRYDILLEGGTSQSVILEGKIDALREPEQLLRYAKERKRVHGKRPGLVVVDSATQLGQTNDEGLAKVRKAVSWCRHVSWEQIRGACLKIGRLRSLQAADPVGTAVATDLAQHLEESGMAKGQPKEIYTRDLTTPWSAELYFRHHIYKCQPKFRNHATGNLYFAPYFTGRSKKDLQETTLLPLGEGVSFVSPIKDIEVIKKKRKDVLRFLKAYGTEDPKRVCELVIKHHKEKEILFLMLGQPLQLFITPVTKRQLSSGAVSGKFTLGAMGSRILTFEDLLLSAQVAKA